MVKNLTRQSGGLPVLLYAGGAYEQKTDTSLPYLFVGPVNPDTTGLMAIGDYWMSTDTGAVQPVTKMDIYDASHTGFKTSQFVTGSALAGALSATDYNTFLTGYGYAAPNLVTILLSTNDYLNGGDTPAVCSTLLGKLIDDLRALASKPSILLMVPHNMVGHEATGRNWADYVELLQALATSKGTGLFLMSNTLPTAGTSNSLLSSDLLHPSDAGHTALANAMKTFHDGLLTSKPAWATSYLTALATGSACSTLWIGDSLVEGQGASTKANRWLDKFLSQMKSAYDLPTLNRKTYYPPWYAVYGPDSTWGSVATTNAGTVNQQGYPPGLGARDLEMQLNSAITMTVVGKTLDVWVSPGATPVAISIDGAAAVNYTVTANSTFQRITGIALGASGTHTVKIFNNSGAAWNYLGGLVVTE